MDEAGEDGYVEDGGTFIEDGGGLEETVVGGEDEVGEEGDTEENGGYGAIW